MSATTAKSILMKEVANTLCCLADVRHALQKAEVPEGYEPVQISLTTHGRHHAYIGAMGDIAISMPTRIGLDWSQGGASTTMRVMPYTSIIQIHTLNLVLRHRIVLSAIKALATDFPHLVAFDMEQKGMGNPPVKVIDCFDAYFRDFPYYPSSPIEGEDSYLQMLSTRKWLSSQPKLDPNEPLWKVRERLNLEKTYLPLPKSVVSLLPGSVMDEQFPHIAQDQSGGNGCMIAYTNSALAGELGRKQTMRAGRYLRRHLPDLDDESIKRLAADCMAQIEGDIHWTSDEYEFARVYMDGPSSCMSHSESTFGHLEVGGEFFHPIRVFAHPENDIRLVWLEVDGRISARALVNTKKKQYPRIYSNDSVANAKAKLEAHLWSRGYGQDDMALAGQILQLVNPDANSDAIICPYIDNGNMGVEIEHDHLVADGEYEADHETGCLQEYNLHRHSCADCSDPLREDEGEVPFDQDDRVCQHCLDHDYTYAYRIRDGSWYYTLGRTFWDPVEGENIIYHSEYNYNILCEDRYDHQWATHSDNTIMDETNGEYILIDDMDQFDMFELPDGDAGSKDDYAVVDGELVRAQDIPSLDQGHGFERDPNPDSDYYFLDHYTTKSAEDAA